MRIHNLSEENSILNNFLFELREHSIQKDSMRFRRNIERIGEILGYYLSKKLGIKKIKGLSPLDKFETEIVSDDLVLCSILRAGIPLHTGLLNIFDSAENAFVSAYRHHTDGDGAFEIKVEYLACPSLENKTLILADPMIATGKSIIAVLEALTAHGTPKRIILVGIIGSRTGIEYLSQNLSLDTDLFIANIDTQLNEFGYIIPGLGDAGDLAFGPKLRS